MLKTDKPVISEFEKCTYDYIAQGHTEEEAKIECKSRSKNASKVETIMDKTTIFIPFAKTNTEERTVCGYASTEALDSQDEIVSKDAIIGALPDYMKFGNIREMHTPSAVGKTQVANIDDKGLFIKVKIVDDVAWKKVQEGVYNGFSIGGRIVSKVGNTITGLRLSEISVVDRPANPEALFTMVKADNLLDLKKEDMGVEISVEDYEDQMEQSWDAADSFISGQVAVFETDQIIDMTEALIWMIFDRIMAGKPTDDLISALEKLKAVAVQTLQDGNFSKKVDSIIEVAKAQATIPADMFAYVSKEGNKYLPFNDKEHLEVSVKKFTTVNFESNDARVIAARVLLSAAKAHEVSIKNPYILSAAQEEVSSEIGKMYNKTYSSNAYFQISKYVNG